MFPEVDCAQFVLTLQLEAGEDRQVRDREQRRRYRWGTYLVAHQKSGEAPMPSPLFFRPPSFPFDRAELLIPD